jgi:hypothetical protein
MDRFDASFGECKFGLLCLCSGLAIGIAGMTYLIFV